MVANYTTSTITTGTRITDVVVHDTDDPAIRPFGTTSTSAGQFAFPPLPVAPAADSDPQRTFTVDLADVFYSSDVGAPLAYDDDLPDSGPITLHVGGGTGPDPGDDLTQEDVTFSSLDMKMTASRASLTVKTTSDAGGDLAATYTLSPVGTALVRSSTPTWRVIGPLSGRSSS